MAAPMAAAVSAADSKLAKLVVTELKRLVANYFASLHALHRDPVLAQSTEPESSSARLVTTAELWYACDQLAASPTTLTPSRILAQRPNFTAIRLLMPPKNFLTQQLVI